MPDSVSTFGPLDPSPGNGPAVSSGISSTAALDDGVLLVVPEALGDGLLVVPEALGVEPLDGLLSVAQPATTARPAPANSLRTLRLRSMPRSYSRPLSWSCISVSSPC
jgi:hypothetical protein